MIEQFIFNVTAQHSALVVVGFSYLLLTIISRLVSRAAININNNNLSPRFSVDTKHTTSEHDTAHLPAEEIKALSDRKDELRLALLCAVYQPTIDQLSVLTQQLRQSPNTQNKGKTANHQPPRSKDNFPVRLTTESFNQQDLQFIREHEEKTHKLINKDFIEKFGDTLFMENFIMYEHLCRIGSKVFHIPPKNELRKLFEMFAKTGIALRGKAIPIGERLRILNQAELESIADDLTLNRTFNTVDQAISILAKLPQTPVHLGRWYHSENLFLLQQEKWDITAIEKEWSVYNTYAKLLCSESLSST